MVFPKILRTKIIPPRRAPRTLARPRVSQALSEALHYRLTLLQAGAGYGKSTALAELAAEFAGSSLQKAGAPPDCRAFIWYQVNQEDSDPLVFLLHLCHATQLAVPDMPDLPTAFLEAWDGSQGALGAGGWRGVVDQYLNALSAGLPGPALLVLDDIHLALEVGEVAQILDRLAGLAPDELHLLLSGRPPLQLPNLARWRAQGEVLALDQAVLSFNGPEVAALFAQQYSYELTADEVDALLGYTEGWAIALQLAWQNLRSHSAAALNLAGRWRMDSPEALFAVLAREVFAQQSQDIQEFLLVTATLRDLRPEACDMLRSAQGVRDSAAMLAYLRRQDLFVVETSEGPLRYHHIFHEFLQQQAPPAQRRTWHAAAAGYFLARQDVESAIYHYSRAGAWEAVAAQLEGYGGALLAAGRLDTLAAHLDALPPETLPQHPFLLFHLGELARLHSRFQEALGWYQQAEAVWRVRGQQDGVARALRGQARVYLDTVNPSKAEELLQQAILLSDGYEDREAQVRLYELLAENKLNSGRVEEAERLRQKAEDLRSEGPSNEQLLFRVLLRTGRLGEARQALEASAAAERQSPVQTPRAHRETLLLLSLIYALQGEGELAYHSALEGTRRGEDLKSPFVTAVGHMRQGHAYMLLGGKEQYAPARQQFEKSVQISRSLNVPRLLVEADWGLCRAYGYLGDLTQAQQVAQEAIEIASQAGDEWIASLVRLAYGASLTLAGRYEAAEAWLNRAALGFQECSDVFGRCAARLWLCLAWQRGADLTAALEPDKRAKTDPLERAGRDAPGGMDYRVAQALPEVLATCRDRGYDFLWTRPSLLGPPDERMFLPLLAAASVRPDQPQAEAAYIARLLGEMGLADISLHPGYQLRVAALGGFQVWRGEEAVPANGWRREKARHLFQLLLTFRHAPLDREQICEHLWPEADPATAARNFKIALNTLYQVLEPERKPGAESAFILREGAVYCIRPEADLWLDAEQFAQQVRRIAHLAESAAEPASGPGGDPARLLALQEALALYQGVYLPDTLYETWAAQERERLAVIFLEAADRLSGMLLEAGQFAAALELCQRILAQDSCWERAYRNLMLAYDRLGDHGQVGRTYQRCVQTLRAELDVPPSAETHALYDALTQGMNKPAL